MKYLVIVLFLVIGAATPAFAATEPPALVRGFRPEYPQEMKAQNISGIVTVNVLIDDHGVVQDAKVVKTTNEAFSKPALEAVKKWKFKPAERDGNLVAVHAEFQIKFTPTSSENS
jgi:protein TonB